LLVFDIPRVYMHRFIR